MFSSCKAACRATLISEGIWPHSLRCKLNLRDFVPTCNWTWNCPHRWWEYYMMPPWPPWNCLDCQNWWKNIDLISHGYRLQIVINQFLLWLLNLGDQFCIWRSVPRRDLFLCQPKFHWCSCQIHRWKLGTDFQLSLLSWGAIVPESSQMDSQSITAAVKVRAVECWRYSI